MIDPERDRTQDELRVQMRFWKQAAEHAIEGWLKQEDVATDLRVKLIEACELGLWPIGGARERLHALRAEAERDDAQDTP